MVGEAVYDGGGEWSAWGAFLSPLFFSDHCLSFATAFTYKKSQEFLGFFV